LPLLTGSHRRPAPARRTSPGSGGTEPTRWIWRRPILTTAPGRVRGRARGREGVAEETIGQARQRLALALIEGAAQLVEFYGYWPSFHDATVEAVLIDSKGPTVTIHFHVNDLVQREGIKEADQRARVTIRWHDVSDLRVSGDPSENWLWEMIFRENEDDVRTELAPNGGFGGTIIARRMEVVDIHAISPGTT
jgi:Immunity protein 50